MKISSLSEILKNSLAPTNANSLPSGIKHTRNLDCPYLVECDLDRDVKEQVQGFINKGLYNLAANQLLTELMQRNPTITPDNYSQDLTQENPYSPLIINIVLLRILGGGYPQQVNHEYKDSAFFTKVVTELPLLQLIVINNLLAAKQLEPAKNMLDKLANKTDPMLTLHYRTLLAIYYAQIGDSALAELHANILYDDYFNNGYAPNSYLRRYKIPPTITQHLLNLILSEPHFQQQSLCAKFSDLAQSLTNITLLEVKPFNFQGELNSAASYVDKHLNSCFKLNQTNKRKLFYNCLTVAYHTVMTKKSPTDAEAQRLIKAAGKILTTDKKNKQAQCELAYLTAQLAAPKSIFDCNTDDSKDIIVINNLYQFLSLLPKDKSGSPLMIDALLMLSHAHIRLKQYELAKFTLAQIELAKKNDSHWQSSLAKVPYNRLCSQLAIEADKKHSKALYYLQQNFGLLSKAPLAARKDLANEILANYKARADLTQLANPNYDNRQFLQKFLHYLKRLRGNDDNLDTEIWRIVERNLTIFTVVKDKSDAEKNIYING